MAGKKYENAAKNIDRQRRYDLQDALKLVGGHKIANFDETVEIAVRLNVDPRQADQNVRGTVVLPNGRGKVARVLVLAKGEKEKEARDAGADYAGGELVKKIQDENWLDFDRVIATPDIMSAVGRIGKILGPRGLMPNPRVGTVTFDIAKAVQEVKAGKVDYRVDKAGVVHAPIGKLSFGDEKLAENARALLASIMRAKPASAKGNYIKSVAVASTMGPGVKVDGQHHQGSVRRVNGASHRRAAYMRKEDKTALVAQLAENLNRASIAVISEYKGIKAGESDDLRRRLRAVQGEFRVAKNTLVRLAIKNTRFEPLEPTLGGAIGLLLSYGDPVVLAKAITSQRELGDRFKVRGGVLEGKPLSATEIAALAALPSREILLSQLLGLLQAPASRLVRLLNEPGSALARLLGAVAKQQHDAPDVTAAASEAD